MRRFAAAWRLFWRIRRKPWRGRYRYGCSCEGFTTNSRRIAAKHATAGNHWVWDHANNMWVKS